MITKQTSLDHKLTGTKQNMKLSSIASLLAASNVQAHPMIRGLLFTGGEQRNKGIGQFPMMRGDCYWATNNSEPLLTRIEEECNAFTGCKEIDVSNLDCSHWETVDGGFMLNEGCNLEDMTDEEKEAFRLQMEVTHEEKRNEWMSMSVAEREALREEAFAVREANAATLIGCACCSEYGVASISNLVKGKEGAVAKTLGFSREPMGTNNMGPQGSGGKQKGHRKHGDRLLKKFYDECSTFDCSVVDIENQDCTPATPIRDRIHFDMDLSETEKEDLKSEMEANEQGNHEQMLRCACCGKSFDSYEQDFFGN